ncbi:hypothetical protein FGIG_01282 [Fasciola gigantica]|uniref:E1 domain-containing protein n=1 Tax=Fasciola gigantica TaxID=46835 RepID=A0A504Z688_FASGI|nr:hypothetical protein FGIG_01282 [Fasciola gigantica]
MFNCRFQMVFLQSVFLLWLTTFICTWGKDMPTAVAFKCGKPSLYLTPLGWNVDGEQSCLHREKDIIAYCQRVYNDTSLVRVAFTTVIEVALPNWCHVNRSDCPPTLANRTTYPIQPWICAGEWNVFREFFRKYMALDEQQREIDSRLDKTHWKRILESMEHHRQMALEQWGKTVENPKSNTLVFIPRDCRNFGNRLDSIQ